VNTPAVVLVEWRMTSQSPTGYLSKVCGAPERTVISEQCGQAVHERALAAVRSSHPETHNTSTDDKCVSSLQQRKHNRHYSSVGASVATLWSIIIKMRFHQLTHFLSVENYVPAQWWTKSRPSDIKCFFEEASAKAGPLLCVRGKATYKRWLVCVAVQFTGLLTYFRHMTNCLTRLRWPR